MQGQRVAKNPEGKRKLWLILGVAAAILAAVYLALCAWVGASDRVFPHVTMAGLDLSGMTREQAQEVVVRQLEEYDDRVAVTLRCGDWSGTMQGSDWTMADSGFGRAAWQTGRESFLLQGGRYIVHLLGYETRVDRAHWGLSFQREQPALEQTLDRAEQSVGGMVEQMSYRVEGETLQVTKGVTGIAFDREAIYLAACGALLEGLDRATGGEGAAEVTVDLRQGGLVTETTPNAPDFDALHLAVFTKAKDAQVLPETLEVTDHAVGIDFSLSRLEEAYARAQEGEVISIPLLITQPGETREGLEAKLFADLLGQATSRVSGTRERKFNVQLSAQACNEVVLMPGEEFSYNNTTGSRTAEKGYLPAPVYIGGKSEDEVGGGICQTSSTIYYAVLHTTLDIVERVNHRYAVGYVPDGMDATVYFGSTDFRFRNSTDYPIKLVTESFDENGARKLTVKIYGTNADGRYAVPERIRTDPIEPTVSYQPDETVPRGTLVLDKKQNAYTGITAQTYRHIYEADGTKVETQNMGISKYKMRPHLYYYNPLDGDPATWVDGKPPVPQPETVNPETNDPVEPGTDPAVTPADPGAGDPAEQPDAPLNPHLPI